MRSGLASRPLWRMPPQLRQSRSARLPARLVPRPLRPLPRQRYVKVSLPNDTASPAADRKVRRFCFLPLPLAGEGRVGGASVTLRSSCGEISPTRRALRARRPPRNRERLSAPPRAISGSHFKQPDTTSHSRGTIRPRFAWTVSLQKIRGRREDRVRAAPAVSCAMCIQRKRTRAYRFSGNTPAFPAQWFYGLYRALPGDRAFLSPSLMRIVFRKLDTSIGVSGPHDFAVRFSFARPRATGAHDAAASIASRVAFRDDCAYAPLVRRDGASW